MFLPRLERDHFPTPLPGEIQLQSLSNNIYGDTTNTIYTVIPQTHGRFATNFVLGVLFRLFLKLYVFG